MKARHGWSAKFSADSSDVTDSATECGNGNASFQQSLCHRRSAPTGGGRRPAQCACSQLAPTPESTTSGTRSSAIDGRTTRHAGYAISQVIRKRIEEAIGWIKTVAGQEKSRFRGVGRVGFAFTFAAAAYNLVRLPKLLAEAG